MLKQMVIFVALSGLLGQAAWADNQNIYCGQGMENYSVDDAQIALVSQDGELSLYLDGQNATDDYTLSTTAEGFSAKANAGSGNPTPSFGFSKCGPDNTTTAWIISDMVPSTPFPCTCETE